MVDGTGGLPLGNVRATGNLNVNSTGGDITNAAGSWITVQGDSTFHATNGSDNEDITLNSADNNFVGQVNARGRHIRIVDGAGPLTLGDMASGDLAFNALGEINQGTGRSLSVAGRTVIDSFLGNVYVLDASPNSFTGGLSVIDIRSRAKVVNRLIPPPIAFAPEALPTPSTSPEPLTGAATSAGVVIASESVTSGIGIEVRDTPTQESSGTVWVVLPKGIATSGTGFSFPLPTKVVEDFSGTASIEVTLAAGSPRPSWLRFDLASKSFVAGAVPDGAFSVQQMVSIGEQRTMVIISERSQ